jgi:hypothetical protein
MTSLPALVVDAAKITILDGAANMVRGSATTIGQCVKA